MVPLERVGDLASKVRTIAVEYYRRTGKPLGVTGELGEYEASRLPDQ